MPGANVIEFPVVNPRFDVSSVSLDQDAVAAEIRMMKLAYFAEVADQMLDDTLRSMSMLNMEGRSRIPTHPIEQKDIILMKESIISGLCRIVGLDHPLHRILDHELILTSVDDDDDYEPVTAYRFKDDPVSG